jgi:hypothetical protein
MIKREDLKVGAEFIDRESDPVAILAVGEKRLFIHMVTDSGERVETTFGIDRALGDWNYPEPKKPRTVEFFEWIDKYGTVMEDLMTKKGTFLTGNTIENFEGHFLAWTGRSFHLEVDENWGEVLDGNM